MIPFADRRSNLQDAVAKEGGRAFLSNAAPDIRYFTGCMDAGGWLLIDDRGVWFLTNAHDAPQAKAEAFETEIAVWKPGEPPLDALARRLKGVPALIASELPASVAGRFERAEIRFVAGLTSNLRRVKEPGELDFIRQAARIVEAGMAAAKAVLGPGVREIDVAAEAERAMRALGADGRVFETKVESGERSAMPSTYASERRMEAGDLVLIDIGPTYRGYFGDLTRTFAIGEPTRTRRNLLELTLAAQANAIASVKADATGENVDEAARATMRAAGHGEDFLHATGHTLGLAGDSLQLLTPGSGSPLRAGECVTVEPGVYVAGVGGVRIEDEILVTETGCEVLTAFAKSIESLIVAG
jgi:Xaa-Pro aminopeptidase